MPPQEFDNLSVKKWIVKRLRQIGLTMNPKKKAATLAQQILSDWITKHDKKVQA